MSEALNLQSRVIEKSYKDLLEYEKEVNNYLLYITVQGQGIFCMIKKIFRGNFLMAKHTRQKNSLKRE